MTLPDHSAPRKVRSTSGGEEEVPVNEIVRRGTGILGHEGEDIACTYLRSLDWRILDRNWRAGRFGELDIVARDPSGLLVFIEVKTRRRIRSNGGCEDSNAQASLGYPKQRKLVVSAQMFMSRMRMRDDGARIDVILVELPAFNTTDKPRLTHIPDCIHPDR